MTGQVLDYKIAIGDWVKRRLIHLPGIMKIPANGLDVFVKRDFLTPDECTGLIKLIDAECYPSEILASAPDPEFRTSHSCNMKTNDPLVSRIEEKLNGLMGIQPEHGETFQGQGIYGFDNASKKYQCNWIDSMSTGLMVSEGTCDAKNTCTFKGSWNDPIKKGPVSSRMTSRWTTPTTEVFEMYGPGRDGKEFKMMELTYTRK